jgi:ferredoxin-NADP reductase
MQEYKVRVIETIHTTPTSITLRMEKPEGFDFKPGQWGYFTIQVEPEKLSHPLSFSSSPTEPHLEFTKRMSGSDFCRRLERMKAGDSISFSGPMGNLVYDGGLAKVTFLAGGIGITPVRSILKNAVDKKIPGEKNLIYGNLNIEEAAFSEEIRQWEEADHGLKVTHVLLDPHEGWNGFSGFIDRTVIEASVPDLHGQVYYISGPPPMVKAVSVHLDDLGIHEQRILTEELEGYEEMV